MKVEKIADHVVYQTDTYGKDYNSFPVAGITAQGEMLVSFRQARGISGVSHIDTCSRAVLVRSADQGKTFTESLLYDDPYDGVQDPCLNVLSDGTLITTFFTWSVQHREFSTQLEGNSSPWRNLGTDHVARIGGLFSIRSRDGGKSWEKPVLVDTARLALRGRGVELPSGEFLIAAYTREGQVHLLVTHDQGDHWERRAVLSSGPGLSETSLFRCASGKLVALSRNKVWDREVRENSPLLTSESFDNGHTWSAFRPRPFYGPTPFQALQLQSGNVLVCYGYRYEPFGIRAFILDPDCENWGQAQESVLRSDGLGFDIGYTSAVQLPDGTIWIYYYFYGEEGRRYIGATTCLERG